MGFEWTKEQEAVINTRNRSVLVSAAAGSGKTAVLVERLISILTDENNPVDIDRLLVVTFTNAAAAEMRERIGRGLDERLRAYPKNSKWQKQKLLLPYAQISTIHSLCLKMIREHFDILDIDPAFRLGDEAELKLLKSDVAERVMEDYYALEDRDFRDFVERYASGKTDFGITDMVLRLYEYSRGFPYPDEWLKQCELAYSESQWHLKNQHPVLLYAMEQLHNVIEKFLPMLDEAEHICMSENGPAAYITAIQSDREWLDKLQEIESYDSAREMIRQISWKRLARVAATVDTQLKDQVKDIHTQLKAELGAVSDDFFRTSEQEIRDEMSYIAPSIKMMVALTRAFSEKYLEEKQDRNMMDFSDLEHYALKLLVDFNENENGEVEMQPTSVADELANFYEEVVCDEYQDSNQVQEMILSVLSGERFGRFNRFMVGDVKQSIYRFRLADAAIFMNKYDAFEPLKEGASQVRIDLHQNFRSRATVLESINCLFRRIMTKSLGGITYDDDAALYPGMAYPKADDKNIAATTEMLLITEDEALSEEDKDGLSSVAIEAKAIAGKIRELTDSQNGLDIYDSDLGSYRKAGYKDIVILLRTVSGWAEQLMDILGQENIPVTAEMSAGFFDTLEIQTMTEFLSVVDNPRQDIALAAVLRSPIVGLTSEELAFIRSSEKDDNLYFACTSYKEKTIGYEKVQTFLAMLKKIREAARYMELYELIQYIYDVTGYYDYVQALPGGQRRKANLDLLIERAVSYAAGSYSGLFNFVRYIEQLKKNEIDFGEAPLPEDGKGRVRIISIHKSKGLEYPIVILAGMGKKINFQDSIGNIVIHETYGIGLDAINLKNRKKIASVYKKFIAKQLNRETLAEELRILYVALTRAKEKLIMTGLPNVKDIDIQLNNWKRMGTSSEGILPDWVLASAKTYLDWLMPCLLSTDNPLFDVRMIDMRELLGREVLKVIEKKYYKEELLARKGHQQEDSEIAVSLDADSSWQYPYQDLLSVKGKYTVSELKKADLSDEDSEELFKVYDDEIFTIDTKDVNDTMANAENRLEDPEEMPDFMKDDVDDKNQAVPVGGAFKGTAYHRVLELLDFRQLPEKVSTDWVKAQMDAMLAQKRLSNAQYERVNLFDIRGLAASELGRRMSDAQKNHHLKRESQFVIGVPISMVHPDINSERLVVVQGIIDAWFEQDGKVVLVDYKTDRVSKYDGAEILRKRYKKQLDYYEYAIEQMTGKKVSERLIYSFALKQAISV